MIYTLPPAVRTIRRTMDATILNAVANDPEVRRWLGGEGAIDLTPIVTNAVNLAVVTADGGFLGVAHGEGRYEVHSLFRPDAPRRTAVRAMREAVNYFFTATDGVELVTKVPADNKRAAGLALLAGFHPLFTSALPWSAQETATLTCLSLSIDRWALRSTETARVGAWLHTTMAAMLAEAGSSLPPHSPDDPSHEAMAGAAVLMVRAGNVLKGVRFYNRYAAWTHHPPIHLLRDYPIVLDLGGLVVEVHGDTMEKLSCQ